MEKFEELCFASEAVGVMYPSAHLGPLPPPPLVSSSRPPEGAGAGALPPLSFSPGGVVTDRIWRFRSASEVAPIPSLVRSFGWCAPHALYAATVFVTLPLGVS